MNPVDAVTATLGDRYRIERELGRGGMGIVYLARDVRLDRPVALKVLLSQYATQSGLRDRFLRETRTAASFSHPNIVPVYAVEESNDFLAYAMAFVEGESLAERVKRAGPLSVRDTVRLLHDVGYALAYAHGRGVVHRDIKPDNIMIERATGRALVMDFGIARAIAAPTTADAEGLTRVGEVVGTPEYMSPEQATGDHVDGRSDLYSLGLTAFFAVTGSPAISGDTTGRVLARQITETLPSVRELRADLPPALAEAIERCAEKNPDDRFANAEALVEALDAAQLAAPEIPLAVRLFGQELGTLSMILIGGAVATYFLVTGLLDSDDVGDELLLVLVVVLSVLATRIMQTFREAKRLGAAGFTTDEIQRGLAATLNERDVRRKELRADPAIHRARRRTLIAAVVQVVGAVVMARAAMNFRHQTGPNYYTVDPPGVVLILSAMIMFGVGAPLLLRSPFRAPIGERLFRLVWLGPIGRGFVRLAARGKTEAAPVVTRTRPTTKPTLSPGVAIPPNAHSQIAALESRVAELERWRKETRA